MHMHMPCTCPRCYGVTTYYGYTYYGSRTMQRLYGVAMNVEATDTERAARIAELPPATRRCVCWLVERIATADTDPRDTPPRDAPDGGDTRASLEGAAAALGAAPGAADLPARLLAAMQGLPDAAALPAMLSAELGGDDGTPAAAAALLARVRVALALAQQARGVRQVAALLGDAEVERSLGGLAGLLSVPLLHPTTTLTLTHP